MADAVIYPTSTHAASWGPDAPGRRLTTAHLGMLTFLVSEVAVFSTLIMTYVVFLKQTMAGEPNPRQVFNLPMVLIGSLCLFSSSATIHLAEKSLSRGRRSAFVGWWGLTIVLGIAFLAGTAREWADLIGHWGLTISRNIFGTTYFTLVGFHAAHVTIGVIVLSIVFLLAVRRKITEHNETGVQVVSWYWHFVDGVWVVVFTLVYLIGR